MRCPANIVTRTSRENDKGLYATMRGGRIDPSSCLDTCWVDDMAVWWFRATCFHGLKYLCVNREVLKTKSLWKQKWKHQTNLSSLPMYSWLVAVWDASESPSLTLLILRQWRTTVLSTWLTANDTLNLVLWVTLSQSWTRISVIKSVDTQSCLSALLPVLHR